MVEEASGKMFDEVIAGVNPAAVYDSSLFTLPANLNREGGETYRGTPDFDDFDDFNNLFLVYKSEVPADSVLTAGSSKEFVVKGLRAKYFVKTRVVYVNPPNLDVAYTVRPTWHKKIIVTVTSPASKDTLVYPAIMSYWN
jgi:hypothetical protein